MSAAKQRGTAWETALVKSLTAFFANRTGLAPRRVAQEGFLDTGDLHGVSPFIIQAKSWRSWEDAMREGLDGAEVQRIRAGEDYGVAIVKRARKSVGGAYAVTTVATWARVLVRLRRAELALAMCSPEVSALHQAATAEDLARPFPAG